MTAAQTYITTGLLYSEDVLGNPIFTWQGNDYISIPSISQFKRELEEGGFSLDDMLVLKVRLFDVNGGDIFTTQPTPQQIVTYAGKNYRIESLHRDPTLSYIRMVCSSTTRGV